MEQVIAAKSVAEFKRMRCWHFWAREDQLAPAGDWRVWLVMAGRGYGKTRMGAEWAREKAEGEPGVRIALIGANMGEARSVMVEGESGLLSLEHDERPEWRSSLGQLTWVNGSTATLYSAAEPESLRGPQHDYAWADEIAKWPGGDNAWDNLMLGLRLGANPQVMATTTPRPVSLVRRLLKEQGVSVTHGRMADNIGALAPGFVSSVSSLYGGTRLGRQELDGELIEELEGALWSRASIERCREKNLPEMRRVVIGVDPPAGPIVRRAGGAGGDECGIIATGLGADGKAYVLADFSVQGCSPEGWARAVANAADAWRADRVIAEANQGGAMVESTLRAADIAMPVKLVHASRGKVARAEPVAALYEAGRAFHCGAFPQLEDQLCGLITGGAYEGPGRSPDRADALVWAMTELMLGGGWERAEGSGALNFSH
ncbi:MAG: terminase family protein [Sphingorhabdus sp.]